MRQNTSTETDRISQICNALRQAIIEQALKPGAKLPEDTLGETFGVGRTIARQAIAQLTSEGLVEHRRNKGAVVATPSWEEARDLFDLRISLEKLVVSRLAGHLSREQIGCLRLHVAEEKAAAGNDEAVSVRLATEFHTILAEMTGSTVIQRYVQEVCRRCGLTLTLYARPHSSECAISEHIEIIDALEQGNAAAANKLMRRHLEDVANRALISPAAPRAPELSDVLAPYVGVKAAKKTPTASNKNARASKTNSGSQRRSKR
ncbi:MAG: GntR family transcriptional regulator [Hyphomicrobiaceae bacterium]